MNEEQKNLITEENNKSIEKQKIRKRLFIVMGIIVGILIFILLILFVIQLIQGRSLSFEEIEEKMKKAAQEYYQVQKELLPQKEGEQVSVDASILSASEYMKPLSELTEKNVSCEGSVEVTKNQNQYVYVPHLDCGKAYQTKELYQAILDQKVVTTGYGLYQIGQEYVYRGELVNNYVKFEGKIWRIVKVTASNQTLLILEDRDYMPSVSWDDRYNEETLSTTGINNYHLSRMKETMDSYYKGDLDFDNIIQFTKSGKEKLASFSLCVGARNKNYGANDNSQECSVREENQVLGLLSVSDYLNASTDTGCSKVLDRACQNYNYLRISTNWWLANRSDENTEDVYYVNTSGVVKQEQASSLNALRPIVYLNRNVMIKGGNGSVKKPFLLK